jgi:hypothetical protein
LWLKLIQTLTLAQTVIIDTTCIFNEYGPTAKCHSSENGLLHHVEKNRKKKQFIEIGYMWKEHSIADINCCVMTCQ